MSFLAIAQMTKDPDLIARVTGCVALENEEQPELWTQRNKWALAAQPGWGAAWDYAIAGNKTEIGKDPGVITDGMILAGVQAVNNIKPRS